MLNMHHAKPPISGLDDLVYASVFSDQMRQSRQPLPPLFLPSTWPTNDPKRSPARRAYPSAYPSTSPPLPTTAAPTYPPSPPSAASPTPSLSHLASFPSTPSLPSSSASSPAPPASSSTSPPPFPAPLSHSLALHAPLHSFLPGNSALPSPYLPASGMASGMGLAMALPNVSFRYSYPSEPLRSFYGAGEGGMFVPSPPRKRHRPTEVQLELLEREFEGNRKPGVKRRMELAKATGMTERQVQVWFQNHRARRKGREEKRVKREEPGGGMQESEEEEKEEEVEEKDEDDE